MTIQEILYLFLIFLSGLLTVNLLIKELTWQEHLGLSFLVGFGNHSVLYFIFVLRMGLPLQNNLVFLICETVLLILFTYVLKKKTKHVSFPKEKGKVKYLKTFLLLISGFVLLYTFLQCIYWPVHTPDAIYLYDFRAKLLLRGNLDRFFGGISFYFNQLYPPFTSLMHFFLYQTGAENPKIYYALIFIALYLVIVGYVKRITKSTFLGLLAGTLTILTPSIWWNSTLASTNITLTAYISIATLYLFDPTDKNTYFGNAILGAMLLGFSAWTRIEPFWMVIAFLVFIKNIFRLKIKNLLIFFAIILPLSYLWPSSVITPPTLSAPTPISIIKTEVYRIKLVTNTNSIETIKYFSHPLYESWGIVLPLFFGVLFAEIVFMKKSVFWIQISTLALTLTTIYAIISFSTAFAGWAGLRDSVYRMATMTIPLYWVNIIKSNAWKKFNQFI